MEVNVGPAGIEEAIAHLDDGRGSNETNDD
jgi:hypothetical protein